MQPAPASDAVTAPLQAQPALAPSTSSSSSSTVLPGHPPRERAYSKHDISALTAPQKAALAQMRERILRTPQGKNDSATEYTHLRFLRARKFDVHRTAPPHPHYPPPPPLCPPALTDRPPPPPLPQVDAAVEMYLKQLVSG